MYGFVQPSYSSVLTCPPAAAPDTLLLLLLLQNAGSDPTKLIEDLAKRKKIKTLGVSMGQGQEIIARKYMATAAAEGQWVLLQNTHLGLAYLTEVEQYLSKAEDLHEDFRCGGLASWLCGCTVVFIACALSILG